MSGRKTYEQRDIDQAEQTIAALIAGRTTLADAGVDATTLATFDPVFFNGLVLVLDRPFVHRARSVIGTGPGPLNELELIVDSLLEHDGVLTVGAGMAYAPEGSCTGLAPGETILLTSAQFERLAVGVFAELEEFFVDHG